MENDSIMVIVTEVVMDVFDFHDNEFEQQRSLEMIHV